VGQNDKECMARDATLER
jgi:hypothetical protein